MQLEINKNLENDIECEWMALIPIKVWKKALKVSRPSHRLFC